MGLFQPVGGWQPIGRHQLVRDRMEVITPLVRGKTVLDCGPGGEEVAPEEAWWQEVFLHAHIVKHAHECIGVDSDKDTIERLGELGYEIREGNVETLDLGRTFDVVVAGELIEHLSNPGLFLDMARRHLPDDGTLVLSTPNAWALGNLIRGLLGRKIVINKGHVAWYDLVMIEQMLLRHGFVVETYYWQQRVFRRATHLVRLFPFWALNFMVIAKPSRSG